LPFHAELFSGKVNKKCKHVWSWITYYISLELFNLRSKTFTYFFDANLALFTLVICTKKREVGSRQLSCLVARAVNLRMGSLWVPESQPYHAILTPQIRWFNEFDPKGCGGQKCPLDTDKAYIPSIFIKTSQKILVKADINRDFLT
jgi:hypothetical protein